MHTSVGFEGVRTTFKLNGINNIIIQFYDQQQCVNWSNCSMIYIDGIQQRLLVRSVRVEPKTASFATRL
jgi:hypothetical protein